MKHRAATGKLKNPMTPAPFLTLVLMPIASMCVAGLLSCPASARESDTVSLTASETRVSSAPHRAYDQTSDGAVLAFTDFFKSMALEFSTTYTGDGNSFENEHNLPQSMSFLDRAALGNEKVNALLHKWMISSRMLGTGGAEIAANGQDVTLNPDGTATLTAGQITYRNTPSGKFKSLGSIKERYTLSYNNGTWLITDVRS